MAKENPLQISQIQPLSASKFSQKFLANWRDISRRIHGYISTPLENWAEAQKFWNDRIPTIHFQVCYVSFRESTSLIFYLHLLDFFYGKCQIFNMNEWIPVLRVDPFLGIDIHECLILMVNVGRYTSPMDPMCLEKSPYVFFLPFPNISKKDTVGNSYCSPRSTKINHYLFGW